MLDKLDAVRQKYSPETDPFKKMEAKNYLSQLSEDSFDRCKDIQYSKKFKYYKDRAARTMVQLISVAQFRLSLFNIFNLTDNVDMVKLKNKKVKNQVKILRERLESTNEISESGLENLHNRVS